MTGKPSLAKSQNMQSASPNDCAVDERIARALEAYAASVEAGAPLDKSELMTRYGDVAEELAACLDSLDFIRQVAPQLGDSEVAGRANGRSMVRLLATLGDFRIIREIGRGGMGVVYEAEQLSLGRRVALKVLPFAAMLDKQRLQRFKNEARAAATLDHPNIVSVFSVGEERGVHYYAMQLVEGRSLADVIAQRRAKLDSASRAEFQSIVEPEADCRARRMGPALETEPAARLSTIPDFDGPDCCRTIARLGVQAALALDHAHQQGVVHRDVKPANLLVDAEGTLWIADFGLARLEADAGMTMTGDLVGTLRYMSPEQALAKRAVVDHRTDIYSLGVTLYELLAGRPAYETADRHELLKRITLEEPRALRHVNPRIPNDLATIVSKAIEKSPDDRFATAKHLADDLERFLLHQPIEARPSSLRQTSAKWVRRHPALVAATVFTSVVISLGAIASAVLLGRAWAEARTAQRQTTAERNRYLGERNRALQNKYCADLRLAHSDWLDGHLTSYDRLLESHVPTGQTPDRRGWEWYYLKSLGMCEVERFAGGATPEWSPNGKLFACRGEDPTTIVIRDAANWQPIATLCGHQGAVTSVDWSPEGDRLASAADDKSIRIWEVADGRSVVAIDEAVGELHWQVAWSPDGTKVASCGWCEADMRGDRTVDQQSHVKIWDADTGEELQRFMGTPTLVRSLAWNPDGTQIASGTNYESSSLIIWDVKSGKPTHKIEGIQLGAAVTSVAWNPVHQLVATAARNSVQVWNTQSWSLEWEAVAHRGGIRDVAWSPDGLLLASAGNDGLLQIWSITGRKENTIRGHRGAVHSVAWSWDGRHLASSSSDGAVKIWDPAEVQSHGSYRSTSFAEWIPADPRCLLLLRESEETGRSFLWRTAPKSWRLLRDKVLDVRPLAGDDRGFEEIEWSHDRRHIAVGRPLKLNAAGGYLVSVFEASSGKNERSITDAIGGFRTMAWNPRRPQLAIASWDQGAVVWNVEEAAKIAHLDFGLPIDSVVWSPNGDKLAVSSADQQLVIYDGLQWQELARLKRPGRWDDGSGRVAAWGPGGSFLVAGSSSGMVQAWDASSWTPLWSIAAHAAHVVSVALSPDGRRLATAGDDGLVKIWDASTQSHLLTLEIPENGLDRVDWSPDGTCLLGKEWTRYHIWDASPAMEGERAGSVHARVN